MWLKQFQELFGSRRIYFLFLLLASPLIGQVIINGTVTDQENKPVESALVRIEPASQTMFQKARTDKTGRFEFSFDLSGGTYLISVSHPGFQETKKEPCELKSGGLNIIEVKLVSIPVFSIDVAPLPDNQIIPERVELSRTINKEDIENIPVTKYTDLKSFISTMPGVFLGPQGKLFFDGSPADQNNYLMENLLKINHPINYDLKHVNTAAVDSFDRFSGRYSVEFGRGSGGAFIIYPKTGSNKWLRGAEDFFPGLEFAGKKGLNLTGWKPRVFISGPIIKDRAFLFNSFDGSYEKNIIHDFTEGKDRTFSWGFNNLLHLQANLTPSNILTSNIMIDYRESPQTGLSPLRPSESTEDTRDRVYFWSVKNQSFRPNTGFEIGYGLHRAFVRRIPQGHGILRMSPQGSSGYSPFDVLEIGGRHQVALSGYRSNIEFLGKHRLKAGLDLQRSSYFQDIKRTGFEHYRLNGTITSRAIFGGSGLFDKTLTETATYLQDEWSPKPWLFLKYGIRWDSDNIVSNDALTPRVSLALMPPGLKRLKIAAGFGLVPESAYLRLFTRHLDQYSIATFFDRQGDIVSGPALTIFTADHRELVVPKSRNMSGGLEFSLTRTLKADINFLRKRIANGYIYAPHETTEPPPIANLPPHENILNFRLKNHQTLSYDSITLGFEKKLAERGFIKGYYSWSRGISNSSLDINIDEPIIFSDVSGPLSWDIPHRFQFTGFVKLTAKNSLGFTVDWRKGNPFTAYDEDGKQVGSFNSYRFPPYFNINVAYERKFRLFRINWAIRPGVENLLDRFNPTIVNANTGLPGFPNFYGVQPRKFVVRVRKS